MKTDTRQKILSFIKERGQTSAKEIIEHIGYNATGIFRHLGKLIAANLIIKQGTPPKVFYLPKNMNNNNEPTIIHNGFVWNEHGNENLLKPEAYCPTRDVFQARLDHLLTDCLRQLNNESLSYLLVAVAGEIGNNSFDHNLGNWHDVMGIYFAADLSSRQIVLADRGQGIFSTIKKVKPSVASDREALQVAFTEIISGRAPEQRGNGLKFVKKIFEEQNWQLNFYSGNASCKIQGGTINFADENKKTTGIVALIKF